MAQPAVRLAALAAWVAALAGAVTGLAWLGHGLLAGPPLAHPADLARWAGSRPPAVAVFAVVRVLAMWAGCYLLATTLFGALARAAGLRRVVAVTDWFSVGLARQMAACATGVAIGMGSLSPAAFAGGQRSAPSVVVSPTPDKPATPGGSPPGPEPLVHMRRLPGTGTTAPTRVGPRARGSPARPGDRGGAPAPPAAAPAAPAVAAPAAPAVSVPPGAAPTTGPAAPAPQAPSPQALWTTRPGDNLWSIAARVLAERLGRQPTDAETATYWAAVIAANRGRLADPSNPDLIFPGQVFVLPG